MSHELSTLQKALDINLDDRLYGSFAEIGAGQEVVRWFFQAGGAAGTIAKSMSAYDMQVSDAIYGSSDRYVSRMRLESMLEYEQKLNRERLTDARGSDTCFFTFADTVSARNFQGTNECHAWMGLRFQVSPGGEDNLIIVHIRLMDDNNAAQQEAVGIVGVNLVHAAYRYYEDPETMLSLLRQGLSEWRIEVDMIDVSGPAFTGIDNRILSLRLVELGLSGAAMFAADGTVLQPSEALRKKPVLVQRGRFRPITHVNMDMLESSLSAFEKHNGLQPGETVPIMEISMQSLKENSEVCLNDFLSRAEVVSLTGCNVMISDYLRYFRLAAYLYRYTHRPIGIAMGLASLRSLFDEQYYEELQGGILESFGRLFKNQLKLLIYPVKNPTTGKVENIESLQLDKGLSHLFDYLVARDGIVPLKEASKAYLDIYSHDVLAQIASGDTQWEEKVPAQVAEKIRDEGLFGYAG
ncbi:MAG: TonB-dependent receptor [Pseudomonadota bacterium]